MIAYDSIAGDGMVSNKLKGVKNLNIPISIKDYEWIVLLKGPGESWEKYLIRVSAREAGENTPLTP